MPIRILQLGSPRSAGEGLRIGTVRRPPRGVPKAEFASRDYYDVWYPELSPEADTMQLALQSHQLQAQGQTAEADKLWKQFQQRFRRPAVLGVLRGGHFAPPFMRSTPIWRQTLVVSSVSEPSHMTRPSR